MTISATTQGLRPGVCTSTSRPSVPFDGQVIYETDTNTLAVYDGSGWVSLNPVDRDRNVVINGAMQVAQRNTSVASITTAGYYTADRWYLQISSAGTWTMSVENDAPTGSGLRKSVKYLCTTADTSLSAGDYLLLEQRIEGQNLQKFKKGTSSAERMTISFWVKSNLTGTYVVELRDEDNARNVSASYTVSVADTWEKKTLTFPSDTTGVLDNDNATSINLEFWLAGGSNFTSGTLGTTWASNSDNTKRAAGQVNLAGATNRYWQVTGVQLEAGAVATPFEFEDYGTTLEKCQRYYLRLPAESSYTRFGLGDCLNTTATNIYIYHPTDLRVKALSVDTTGTASNYAIYHAGGITALSSLPSVDDSGGRRITVLSCPVASGLTGGRVCQLLANNVNTAYIGIGAEL